LSADSHRFTLTTTGSEVDAVRAVKGVKQYQ